MKTLFTRLTAALSLALTLFLTYGTALAQGTASGPVTSHIVEPGPVVNIGSLIDPIPIDLDVDGPPWFKNVSDPNGVLTAPTDLFFNETIINVGTEPWYDWHEVILDPPFGLPQSNWLAVKMFVNGLPITFNATGLGTPTLDLDGFSSPVLPGDVLMIEKIIEAYDSTPASGGPLYRILEYPTPEPASLAVMGLGAVLVLGRRKEVASIS